MDEAPAADYATVPEREEDGCQVAGRDAEGARLLRYLSYENPQSV